MDNVWFCETVHREFKFLTLEFGFSAPISRCAGGALGAFPSYTPSQLVTSIIYTKDDRYVEAAMGTHGVEFEVILGFGKYSQLREQKKLWTFLEDLLYIVAPDYEFAPSGVFTSLQQKFAFFIRENATALYLHGGRFFDRDPGLWLEVSELKRRRIEERRVFEIQRENQRLRNAAKNAFENSQWELTVKNYHAVTDRPSKSEEKRLLIAEKRLARGR